MHYLYFLPVGLALGPQWQPVCLINCLPCSIPHPQPVSWSKYLHLNLCVGICLSRLSLESDAPFLWVCRFGWPSKDPGNAEGVSSFKWSITSCSFHHHCCSVAQLGPALCDPWTAALQVSLSFTVFWSLPKLMSIESVVPSNHLILRCPLLPLPSIFPSIKVFSNELVLHIQWPKYWSFSFSITPSSEYSGLISFGIDWFYLFAVQVTVACFSAGLVYI